MKNQEEMIQLFKEQNYNYARKSGEFRFEIAQDIQEVVTSLEGVTETRNTAIQGDYILTGKAGRNYNALKAFLEAVFQQPVKINIVEVKFW